MNDLEFVIYEKSGHIARLTINRPEYMNALHPPAHLEMARVWDDFEADDDAWVAIVTGAGDRAFSAGADLRYRAAQTDRELSDDDRALLPRARGGFAGITNPSDRQVWKPIIAAVNGYALGGGLELAMACDIIVAAETAQFGLPEPRRGIIAGAGGIHRLPRMIPVKIAMGYMLTGRHMSAAEAYRWGLVNEVVPASELMAAAERWANDVMECAPLSLRATKQGAMEGLDRPLEEAMNATYFWQQAMIASDDAKEGPRAFAEKRKPNWTGH